MSDLGRRITRLVDAILAHPPTDNAELLSIATQMERDAAYLDELSETWCFQARRLRDYAAARQAQMDAPHTPDNATTSPAVLRG